MMRHAALTFHVCLSIFVGEAVASSLEDSALSVEAAISCCTEEVLEACVPCDDPGAHEELLALIQGSVQVRQPGVDAVGRAEEPAAAAAGSPRQLGPARVLEKAVLAELQKGAPTNAEFVETVTKLIDQLRVKIRQDKDSWQKQLDTSAEALRRCDVNFLKDGANANLYKSRFAAKRLEHGACREREESFFREQQRCRQVLVSMGENERKEQATLKVIKRIPEVGICSAQVSETYEEWTQRMKGEFEARIKELAERKLALNQLSQGIKSNETACAEKITSYEAKKTACDTVGYEMDAAKCKEAIETQRACDKNSVCYGTALKTYNETEPIVKLAERDFKTEWEALGRMQCYFGALGKSDKPGSANSTVIEVCKVTEVDTTPLNMNYPKLASLKECKKASNYPCTQEYQEAEYDSLSQVTPGRCQPCVGIS